MSGNTLNISGQVKQGATLVTSGYVRIQNLNRPSAIVIVPIGTFEDGTLEAGRYDAWFRAQEEDSDIVAIGDVFELKVFSALSDATNNISSLFNAQQTPVITIANFNISYLNYELQLSRNLLPNLPVISSEDIERYANNRVVYWTWITPTDPDGDNIHFQLEWGPNSEFFIGTTKIYNTLDSVDRSLFSCEVSPDNWQSFPFAGITPLNYGKKCRIRIVMTNDSAYYWRIRATDAIDR